MAVSESDLNFILDQLGGLEDISHKKMFGGIGFFHQDKMFGMIGMGKFRLKVNDETKIRYEAQGMEAFHSKKKGKGMPYYEVPADVLENKSTLQEWALEAIAVAHASK